MSYTDDIRGWIDAWVGRSDARSSILVSRLTDKSAFPAITKTFVDTEAPIRGLGHTFIIADDILEAFPSLRPRFDTSVIATFKNEEWPEATVTVTLEKLDKRDPRNPNPAAGSVRNFFVIHDGTKTRHRNLTTATAQGERLHKSLVAKAVKERDDAIAEAERLRQEQMAQLQSLPTFGGF